MRKVMGYSAEGAVSADPTRITDYTVPFGAFGGPGARGFDLTAARVTLADTDLIDQPLNEAMPVFAYDSQSA